MNRSKRIRRCTRRRGVVAVKVAVLALVLLGFTALAVDMGAIYDAKAELQRTADAAVLAAAEGLVTAGDAEPTVLALSRAVEYAANNTVWGQPMELDPATDVTFGRASYNPATGGYDFTASSDMPDAVQVCVRKTADSPNGAFGLYFASVLGVDSVDLSATATAMTVPRDIAIVADLSDSHNDDSELRHYQDIQINLHEVWDALPGGIDDSPGLWAEYPEYGPDDPQAAGPGWGYMKAMGYGTEPITSSYDPTADPGLIPLPIGLNWNDAALNTYLSNFAGLGYSPEERNTINSRTSGSWQLRVAVALGLARWDSGITYGEEVPPEQRGLWERLEVPPDQAGDGDALVEAGELVWVEAIGERSLAESQDIWLNYVQGYMRSTMTEMYEANHEFRYRFGIKTFINYLMERRPSHSETPELADTPAQPMQAVKDSVQHMVELLDTLGTNDQVSLEIYGTTAHHRVPLTQDFLSVGDHLNGMQAGHIDGWTNMGGGMFKAIEQLTGELARPAAKKVMLLLTDGYANVTEAGATGDYPGGEAYARQQADAAVELGIQIFCISVGSYSDTALMADIAEVGSGEHFHAEGAIDQVSDQLDAVFQTLGGLRSVTLID